MNYDRERAMYEQDCTEEMIRMRDPDQSTEAILRKKRQETKALLRRQHEALRLPESEG